MDCLAAVANLGMPSAMICAGFIRNLIWDIAHAYPNPTPLMDVDVVWFDTENTDRAIDEALEKQLRKKLSCVRWQVRNQARMHLKYGVPAYSSSIDAVLRFPETATCLAAQLHPQHGLILSVDAGLIDAWSLCLAHNRRSGLPPNVAQDRAHTKAWQQQWPNLSWRA
ncbi:nucleotidyltransferase family protein [Deefgea piscis]|uniref:nucleotidyltransferase family protein n=1 Tax=Deefgea piscis TaxID=2739061 RepID=UPI001C8100DF|nr:nucleotidyltransferase family protein [Deefgea piscis]QZA81431.1 nucleotidyltransferase family protein [Deefgea piscis]